MTDKKYQDSKAIKRKKWYSRKKLSKDTAKKGYDGRITDFVDTKDADEEELIKEFQQQEDDK